MSPRGQIVCLNEGSLRLRQEWAAFWCNSIYVSCYFTNDDGKDTKRYCLFIYHTLTGYGKYHDQVLLIRSSDSIVSSKNGTLQLFRVELLVCKKRFNIEQRQPLKMPHTVDYSIQLPTAATCCTLLHFMFNGHTYWCPSVYAEFVCATPLKSLMGSFWDCRRNAVGRQDLKILERNIFDLSTIKEPHILVCNSVLDTNGVMINPTTTFQKPIY